jgi:lysophospholipase L1-like esterase
MKFFPLIASVFFLLSAAHAQFMQAIPAKTASNSEARADKMETWLQDWPNLARYRRSNAELAAKRSVPGRVVFMGDSIFDVWKLEQSFPGRPYVDRGIGGQTTSQMLLRFQQDVVNLHPSAVVLLAGTNDIAGNTGPISLDSIENNFSAMGAIARANNIPLILLSILPVHNYTGNSERFFRERPLDQIRTLNAWLKHFADRNQHTYVDLFTPMLDEKGLLKRELADDGLHPNAQGYAMMAKAIQPAIDKAISISAKKGN